jgi:hypothetical protein
MISGSRYDFKGISRAIFFGGEMWVASYTSNAVTEISASTGALVRVIRGSK